MMLPQCSIPYGMCVHLACVAFTCAQDRNRVHNGDMFAGQNWPHCPEETP